MNKDQIGKLKELLKVVNESITRKEFLDAFKAVYAFIQKIEDRNTQEIERFKSLFLTLSEQLKNEKSHDITEFRQQATELVDSQLKNIEALYAQKTLEIEKRVNMIQDGLDGIDGMDGKDGKDGSPDTPEEVRNKLSLLEGDERLDISHIKGLEEGVFNPLLDRAIGILDQRTQYLINKTTTASSSPNITLTTTGTSGSATYDSGTGVLNIPQYAGTTYSGTTDRISVSGSVIDIAATYVGQSSITTLGTITTGIWHGSAITDSYIASAATWNGKQDAISLTTTGTSGVATLVGATLNIPNYTYTLPTASTSVLGGVKVDGTSITISGGVISAVAGGSGTVTSVSITSANGFAGSVADASSTPAITISTTVTGILKGNGTAISAATDGSDYLSSTTGVKLDQTSGQTIGTTGARLTKLWATDITVTNAIAGSVTGNAGTATALQNARTIGGVSFDGTANITVASATGGFTISGGNLDISANNIITDTTTGTKIGTATNQKIGFFNSTPIVKPSGDVITALQNLGLVSSATIVANTITSRTLWGQTYDGSGNVSGSLTAVGDITGGASSMIITAGTGNSRTLTLKSTTSGGVATAFITGNADQSTTFGGNISGTGAWTITGGAGNMTIISGTGASRTMIFQTTTSGSTATTALTIGADQSSTFAGTVALGANNLTMTGSIAATGARVTKGWFTDIESTNMPTVGGTAILTSLTAPQFTTIELGAASDTTLARVSAGVISVEGVTVATASNTLTFTNKSMSEAQLTFTDITTGNVSTSAHGFAPKAPNSTSQFLRGDGTWAAPTGTSSTRGVATRDMTTASGNQTIAHGLGATPSIVKFTAYNFVNAQPFAIMTGYFDGTGQKAIYGLFVNNTSNALENNDATHALYIPYNSGNSSSQAGIVTVDGTNITIAWTKTGSPTGTLQILWEAIA